MIGRAGRSEVQRGGENKSVVIPGREQSEEPGISRFRVCASRIHDVQLHIGE
jgi:hypothetical protein